MIVPQEATDDLGMTAKATARFLRYTLVLRYREASDPAFNPRVPIEIQGGTCRHSAQGGQPTSPFSQQRRTVAQNRVDDGASQESKGAVHFDRRPRGNSGHQVARRWWESGAGGQQSNHTTPHGFVRRARGKTRLCWARSARWNRGIAST